MKSATRTFCECGTIFGTSLHSPNAVALFFEFERATVQERRGRLLECACEVCFPKACVDGERSAKDVWVFQSQVGVPAGRVGSGNPSRVVLTCGYGYSPLQGIVPVGHSCPYPGNSWVNISFCRAAISLLISLASHHIVYVMCNQRCLDSSICLRT